MRSNFKSHLVIAKVTVLFLFSVAYELLGFCIGILIALAQGISLNGWALQLFLTFCTGILLWAAALPCIILVVWCNKSYIISVIIAFFYTLLGFALHLSDAIMMKPLGLNISTFIPVPMVFRWLYQFKVPEREDYDRLLQPSKPVLCINACHICGTDCGSDCMYYIGYTGLSKTGSITGGFICYLLS